MSERLRCFAVCPKGVEPVLTKELHALGYAPTSRPGGATFETDLAGLYRASLWLRTANRVLLTVASFPCDGPDTLYEGVKAVPWERWGDPGRTIAVVAVGKHPRFKSPNYAVMKAKDAVCDRFRERTGARPSVDAHRPDLSIHAYLSYGKCILSLDSSGRPLHERGYRKETGLAPLRETLAAALLKIAGWDGSAADLPLADPMCGSGTIAVEAALIARNHAPGLTNLSFGFQKWSGFEPRVWRRVVEEAEDARRPHAGFRIWASDRDPQVLRAAKANSLAAGVGGSIDWKVADALTVAAPAPRGTIVTNPPYGERLAAGEDLAALYPAWGKALVERWKGWSAYILSGDPRLPARIGLKPLKKWTLMNGPIECRYVKFGTREKAGAESRLPRDRQR